MDSSSHSANTDEAELRRAAQTELQYIRSVFDRFDEDHSNSIDLHELKAVMEYFGVSMEDDQLRDILSQIDTENKGCVNFEQFIDLIAMWKDASQFRLFELKNHNARDHIDRASQVECLLSDSWGRVVWDSVLLVWILISWVLVLLQNVYGFTRDSPEAIALESIATVLFVVDVFVASITYRRSGGPDRQLLAARDMRRSAIAAAYLKSPWMVVDVLAAFPFFAFRDASYTLWQFRHFRLLKVLRLMTFYSESGFFPMTSAYIRFHFAFRPVLNLIVGVIVAVHGLAVVWIAIKQHSRGDLYVSTDGHYPYSRAVLFIIYSLTTVGYGGDVVTNGEKGFACALLAATFFLNGYTLGKLVSILQAADVNKARKGRIRETLAVIRHFDLPWQLQSEILQFQDHVMRHHPTSSYHPVVATLPEEMRSNFGIFIRVKLLRGIPLFADSHDTVVVALGQRLVDITTLPEQYVMLSGERASSLFFVNHGFLDESDEGGGYIKTYSEGEYFGDMALFTSTFCKNNIKSLTFCELYVLTKEDFFHVLKRFPLFKAKVRSVYTSHTDGVEEEEKGGGGSGSQDGEADPNIGKGGELAEERRGNRRVSRFDLELDAQADEEPEPVLMSQKHKSRRATAFGIEDQVSGLMSAMSLSDLKRVESTVMPNQRRGSVAAGGGYPPISAKVLGSAVQQARALEQKLTICTENLLNAFEMLSINPATVNQVPVSPTGPPVRLHTASPPAQTSVKFRPLTTGGGAADATPTISTSTSGASFHRNGGGRGTEPAESNDAPAAAVNPVVEITSPRSKDDVDGS